jgi:hypothetical protein
MEPLPDVLQEQQAAAVAAAAILSQERQQLRALAIMTTAVQGLRPAAGS